MTQSSPGTKQLDWTFPLPRTHTGMLIGNGVQGLMVWGDSTLNITVGRSGFWDHRGGAALLEHTTYSELRAALEHDDEEAVKAMYNRGTSDPGSPDRPIQLGCGRLELTLPDGATPVKGQLNLSRGIAMVDGECSDGTRVRVSVHQSMRRELAWVVCDDPDEFSIAMVPTWDHVGGQLAEWGYKPPEQWRTETGGGFCQATPADGALSLSWRRRDEGFVIATALESNAESARSASEALVTKADLDSERQAADELWASYWDDVPELDLPDPLITEIWAYGVYKQAGMSTPGGVAASLQGPWLEEYQIPPWSSDYHFNINIEMIYWPCLGTNRLDHLEPLWDMIKRWMPKLRHNAESFFGVDDALMLPHAVDDECNVQGQFWTGTIDHACTAWMAQLAWLHYRYSMNTSVLEEIAWPLLVGAFNGYWAMLEEREVDGKSILSLPVSVSPEYNGAGMDAWGRNASFQLAALHFVAGTLPQAASTLGKPVDPRWEEVQQRVPAYTTIEGETGFRFGSIERIALWEGQDLSESHRHHSHLGSIYPFCTIDPSEVEHRQVVGGSLFQWIRKGMGAWTGWCIPWASIICSRLGFADAATALLHWWKQVYTNEGRGTLHNAAFNGITIFDNGYFSGMGTGDTTPRPEVMQMDAGMGAVTAILELLVQFRDGVMTVLPSIPATWKQFSFDGVRTEGAFLVGADVERGALRRVRIESLAGGTIRIAHTDSTKWLLDGEALTGAVAEFDTVAGIQYPLEVAGEDG